MNKVKLNLFPVKFAVLKNQRHTMTIMKKP